MVMLVAVPAVLVVEVVLVKTCCINDISDSGGSSSIGTGGNCAVVMIVQLCYTKIKLN